MAGDEGVPAGHVAEGEGVDITGDEAYGRMEDGDSRGFQAFEVRWKSERGLVHQLMAATLVGGRVMIFTATMPMAMPPDTRDGMLRLMASFRAYSEDGAG